MASLLMRQSADVDRYVRQMFVIGDWKPSKLSMKRSDEENERERG
jgi:hypothetical protein